MPFHPEELYKHVKELERLYSEIPLSDTNARTAQAKAIVSCTDSFVEGCLSSLFRQTLAELGVPEPLRDPLLRGSRSLGAKLEFAKQTLAPLRNGWKLKDDGVSQFVEDRLRTAPGLPTLRNKIDHGGEVTPSVRLLPLATRPHIPVSV